MVRWVLCLVVAPICIGALFTVWAEEPKKPKFDEFSVSSAAAPAAAGKGQEIVKMTMLGSQAKLATLIFLARSGSFEGATNIKLIAIVPVGDGTYNDVGEVKTKKMVFTDTAIVIELEAVVPKNETLSFRLVADLKRKVQVYNPKAYSPPEE